MALTNSSANYLVVTWTDFGYNVKIAIYEDYATFVGPLTAFDNVVRTNVYCSMLPSYLASVTTGAASVLDESVSACEQALLDTTEYSTWFIYSPP